MRKHAGVLAVCAIAAGGMSCFNTPLGPPGRVAVNPKLLGAWQCKALQPSEDGTLHEARLDLIPFDDAQYYVEWRDGDDVTRYRAYATRLNGVDLLNVEELTNKFNPWPWSVVRAQINAAGELELDLVGDPSFNELSDKAAAAAIKRRVRDSSLYQGLARCTARE